MNLHRGNGDMLRWITRFELSVQRMQEAWNDTYLPITDPMNAEVRAFIAGLPAEEQATITNDDAMERANERLRDQHARTIPITANLVALIFVSLSDLTQDQRQVLTSLMAHRNRVLPDYRMNELREVYLEIFCTTKTSVDNPLLAPSGHGGRKTFLVIDEGYLDNQEGYWVEDEEDGAEGFLEADEDTFWVYDEDNYTWFQRRFQGRKMKRGFKGQRKGKGKGRKGSGGRRFFKKRKGRSNLADNNTDAWQADGQWQDDSWQESSWDDWSWDYAEESYAAKGKGKKGKKGKGKGKYGKNDGKDGKGGSEDGAANLADSAQGSTAIAAATTFYTSHLDFNDFLSHGHRESRGLHHAAPDSNLDGFGSWLHEGDDIKGGSAGPDEVLRSEQGLWHLVQHRRVPVKVHLRELRIYIVQTEACGLHVRSGVRGSVH